MERRERHSTFFFFFHEETKITIIYFSRFVSMDKLIHDIRCALDIIIACADVYRKMKRKKIFFFLRCANGIMIEVLHKIDDGRRNLQTYKVLHRESNHSDLLFHLIRRYIYIYIRAMIKIKNTYSEYFHFILSSTFQG